MLNDFLNCKCLTLVLMSHEEIQISAASLFLSLSLYFLSDSTENRLNESATVEMPLVNGEDPDKVNEQQGMFSFKSYKPPRIRFNILASASERNIKSSLEKERNEILLSC